MRCVKIDEEYNGVSYQTLSQAFNSRCPVVLNLNYNLIIDDNLFDYRCLTV